MLKSMPLSAHENTMGYVEPYTCLVNVSPALFDGIEATVLDRGPGLQRNDTEPNSAGCDVDSTAGPDTKAARIKGPTDVELNPRSAQAHRGPRLSAPRSLRRGDHEALRLEERGQCSTATTSLTKRTSPRLWRSDSRPNNGNKRANYGKQWHSHRIRQSAKFFCCINSAR